MIEKVKFDFFEYVQIYASQFCVKLPACLCLKAFSGVEALVPLRSSTNLLTKCTIYRINVLAAWPLYHTAHLSLDPRLSHA